MNTDTGPSRDPLRFIQVHKSRQHSNHFLNQRRFRRHQRRHSPLKQQAFIKHFLDLSSAEASVRYVPSLPDGPFSHRQHRDKRRETVAMTKTYDYLFKLVLLGDNYVGKTCLLHRFGENVFKHDVNVTIGVDFKIKTIELDGKKVQLQMWDTAGHESFRKIIRTHYRGAMGIMLIYDVTNEDSFYNIRDWIHDFEEHASSDVEKILVGNKCDMNDRRQVSRKTGEKFAIDYGIKFLETSAKSNINVEEGFLTLARDIMSRPNRKMNDSNLSGGGPVKISESRSKKSLFR